MGGSFVLTEEEATLGVAELRGDTLWIRPTPRAQQVAKRTGVFLLLFLISAPIAWRALGSVGGWFFVVLVVGVAQSVVTIVQMRRAAVILEPDRLRVRNLWFSRRVRGIDVTHVWIENLERGSLWSNSDVRWNWGWREVQLIVIARGGGQRIVADALRSDREIEGRPSTQPTIAELRVGVIERWRSAYWVATGESQST